MTGAPFILFGQLLGLAFAAGLNLYSTIALLGIGAELGWTALPPELRGLQHPIIIASAAALYLVEFVVDKIPRANTVWDTLHTIIRPAAAATLAVAALGGAPLPLAVAVGTVAAGAALLAHGTKAGVRATLLGGRGAVAHSAASILEDVLAVGLAAAALRYPQAALVLGAGAVALTVPLMPRLSRAFALGLRGAAARARSLFLGGHWRHPREMPRALRGLLDPEIFGFGTPAVTRVAVRGLPGVGAYRSAWLVLAGGRPMLLFRAGLRPRLQALPPGDIALEHGFWADVATIRHDRRRYSIYFLKDGPAPELALAELRDRVAAGT